MDYTKNLQLGKPRDEEYYSVDVFNHNADLIDEAVSTHKHAAGDITSGMLPPERGGTGQNSLANVTVGKASVCTGNAATATKLQTARKINGVSFDGGSDITVTAAANGGNADTVDGKHASDFALQSWTASQLAGKADLELAKYDRFNQYPAFTAQNIFANPPLQVLPVGIHYFCFDGMLPGAPLQGNRYWSITIDKPSINADRVIQFARQIYASTDIQAVFFRMRHVDNNDFTQWQPWQRVATTDLPQKFDLRLRAGFTGTNCRYYKNSSGIVIVHYSVQRSGTSNDIGDIDFADLPEGFRPSETICSAAGAVALHTRAPGWIKVYSTGMISANFGANPVSVVTGTIIFYAAS